MQNSLLCLFLPVQSRMDTLVEIIETILIVKYKTEIEFEVLDATLLEINLLATINTSFMPRNSLTWKYKHPQTEFTYIRNNIE